jgi:pimeloyl-ACP methyl ester carboxylesterase
LLIPERRTPLTDVPYQPPQLAKANGIEICYDIFGTPDAEPLFLIMGLSAQMVLWDDEFCQQLAARGFRVVRFDNRDIGRSTKIESAGVPRRTDLMLGRRSSAPYLLRDMATDTTGLMDRLGIESAHLVGASMGGMIAQTVAIEHPDRVRSLASMLSNTGSRWTGMPSRRAMAVLLARPPRGREAAIERAVKTFKVIGSPAFPFEEERVRQIAGRSYDRGHSSAGILRQLYAITASGDRTQALRAVRAPTTVIHGNRDPLVRPAGGRATARAIPGARLRMIDGMGHDFPRQLWPLFADEIAANAARSNSLVKQVV